MEPGNLVIRWHSSGGYTGGAVCIGISGDGCGRGVGALANSWAVISVAYVFFKLFLFQEQDPGGTEHGLGGNILRQVSLTLKGRV